MSGLASAEGSTSTLSSSVDCSPGVEWIEERDLFFDPPGMLVLDIVLLRFWAAFWAAERTELKNPPEGWFAGVGAALSIGVSGAVEMLDNLLGTILAEPDLPRLCDSMLPSAEPELLRGDSNRDGVVLVGVGGVLTITGVPLSDAAGGVPGGVPVSKDLGLG